MADPERFVSYTKAKSRELAAKHLHLLYSKGIAEPSLTWKVHFSDFSVRVFPFPSTAATPAKPNKCPSCRDASSTSITLPLGTHILASVAVIQPVVSPPASFQRTATRESLSSFFRKQSTSAGKLLRSPRGAMTEKATRRFKPVRMPRKRWKSHVARSICRDSLPCSVVETVSESFSNWMEYPFERATNSISIHTYLATLLIIELNMK